MRARILFLFVFIVCITFNMVAEGIDGRIDEDEYTSINDFDKMKLYTRRLDGEYLSVGLIAETDGWVAAGFGSLKMAGSSMVMGLVKRGEGELVELTAKGHMPRKAKENKVTEWAVSEENDQTVLEFVFPIKEYLSSNKIEMILAYSGSDRTWMKHSFRTSLVLSLQ